MPLTASGVSGTALLVPPTQNTAPVIEFNCLYTHDLRRKSKRWQDGFLRFHTFNKRVMVYDVPRNLIGDTHLTDGRTLSEGDELRLEKGGVLVEVADLVGQTETDLTNVLRIKNPATSSSPPRPHETPPAIRPSRQPLQEKHRSLNALLGTNRAPIGKAIPLTRTPFTVRSPFEVRRDLQSMESPQPPSKRRRLDLRHDKPKVNEPRSADNEVNAVKPKASTGAAERLTSGNIIDLCSDDHNDEIFSSMLLTPPRKDRCSTNKAKHQPPSPSNPIRDSPLRAGDASKSSTRHREANGKRLQIAKGAPKRSSLACAPLESADDDDDVTEKQRQRLAKRIARLAQQPRSVSRPKHDAQITSVDLSPPMKRPTRKSSVGNDTIMTPYNDIDITEEEMMAALAHSSPARHVRADIGEHGNHVDADAIVNDDAMKSGACSRDGTVLDQNEPPDDAVFDTEHDDAVFEGLVSVDIVHKAAEDDEVLQASSDTLDARDTTDKDLAAFETLVSLDDRAVELEISTPVLLAHDEKNGIPSPVSKGTASTEWSGCADNPNDLAAMLAHTQAQEYKEQESVAIAGAVPNPTAFQPKTDIGAAQDAVEAKSKQPRRRRGVGRLVVGSSTSTSFKPPKLTPRVSNPTTIVEPSVTTEVTGPAVTYSKVGAWSRDIFDLMTWRPPGWSEDLWRQPSE